MVMEYIISYCNSIRPFVRNTCHHDTVNICLRNRGVLHISKRNTIWMKVFFLTPTNVLFLGPLNSRRPLTILLLPFLYVNWLTVWNLLQCLTVYSCGYGAPTLPIPHFRQFLRDHLSEPCHSSRFPRSTRWSEPSGTFLVRLTNRHTLTDTGKCLVLCQYPLVIDLLTSLSDVRQVL